MPPEEIRADLYRFLEAAKTWRKIGKNLELQPFKPNRNHVHNLVDAVQARACLSDSLSMPAWLDGSGRPAAMVPMRNGLLDLASGHLHAHTPRYFQGYSLPFDHDPLAPAPVEWLKFLASLWPDDAEAIATLQEVMGLLLTDDTSHHKLFLMVGPPRSGKGTIARIIQALLGKKNVAGPTGLPP